ncbi:MAG: hypothetical protein WC712_03050 [Candidatus Brocadiia bacterium]
MQRLVALSLIAFAALTLSLAGCNSRGTNVVEPKPEETSAAKVEVQKRLTWNIPVDLASDALYMSSKLRFDGNFGLAYFSPSQKTVFYDEYTIEGTRLSSVKVLTGFADCRGLALGLSFCDKPLIILCNSVDKYLYFVCHDTRSLPGYATAPGWAIKVLDNFGDVGSGSTWDTIENGCMLLAYVNSTISKIVIRSFGGPSGPAWVQTIPYDGTPDGNLSFSINRADGEPVVAFHDAKTKSLICARRKAGAWTTEVVDKSGDVGYFCKVRTSITGEILIAYQDLTDANHPVTKVAHKTAESWAVETADSAPSGYKLDLVLDAAQHPHILSTDGTAFRYACNNGSAWEAMTIPCTVGIEGDLNLYVPKTGKPTAFLASGNKIRFMNTLAAWPVDSGSPQSGWR